MSLAAGQWLVIAQGAYTAAPASNSLPDIDVYPLLGPMGGGTEIMLQVNLRVSCSFLAATCMRKPCCLAYNVLIKCILVSVHIYVTRSGAPRFGALHYCLEACSNATLK